MTHPTRAARLGEPDVRLGWVRLTHCPARRGRPFRHHPYRTLGKCFFCGERLFQYRSAAGLTLPFTQHRYVIEGL